MHSKTCFTIANLPREIVPEIYLSAAWPKMRRRESVRSFSRFDSTALFGREGLLCAILQFCDFSQRINSLFIPKLWRIKSDQFTTSEISETAPINSSRALPFALKSKWKKWRRRSGEVKTPKTQFSPAEKKSILTDCFHRPYAPILIYGLRLKENEGKKSSPPKGIRSNSDIVFSVDRTIYTNQPEAIAAMCFRIPGNRWFYNKRRRRRKVHHFEK